MLSYFALITLVKLSGLLIPFIWLLIIADRRGRLYGTLAIVLMFIVSYINTYFNLPDLAYPSLIDGWLMWFIAGMIIVAALRRFLYSPNAAVARTKTQSGVVGQIVERFTGTFGWIGKIAMAVVIAVIVFIILGSITSLVTQMNPRPAVQSIKTDMNDDTKNAPMPVIKNSAETPVVNAPQTISTDMNNSLNSFKNSNVYDLNHMRVQMFKGKMIYVAPVEFSGGFLALHSLPKGPRVFQNKCDG